ncbi:MAG: hypothetical protein CMN30_21085 [Sandaracinus sp.]|mgnify:FL=1|nr:hypothetical protein [Sandaracinus sp.]
MVREIWLYSLADAARQTRTTVHMATLMPNHLHTDVTPSEPDLPEFAERFHTSVAKGVKRLLQMEGYDVPTSIFDGRAPHYLRLLDSGAQMSQVIYDYLNPSAAGLLANPAHMPGRALEFGAWNGDGMSIERPVVFGSSRPAEVVLRLRPSAAVLRSFDGDVEQAIYHHRRVAREALGELRSHRSGSPLGAQKLRRLNPFDEPRTYAEPRNERIPRFRIGARGMGARQQRRQAHDELREFRRAHEAARLQRLEGHFDVEFPHGTYAMRRQHGVRVADPHENALLIAPAVLPVEPQEAPSPEEVEEQRAALVNEVREAFRAEAREILEGDRIDYDGAPAGAEGSAGARPEAVTQEFDDPRAYAKEQPRRVVVRRKRKRKRGSDPPE